MAHQESSGELQAKKERKLTESEKAIRERLLAECDGPAVDGTYLSMIEDGSVELACPPLKALLHIMAHGNYEGRTVSDPEIRSMFTQEALLSSTWYADRLRIRQQREQQLWQRHVESLEIFLNSNEYEEEKVTLRIAERLEAARQHLAKILSNDYLVELHGTLGADRL